MQPLEIAIFAVVLTAVSLAAAQTAFLNLPEDPVEVSLINKVIGQLGMLAAGFALFLSPAVLGIDQSLILIMLVLGSRRCSFSEKKNRERPATATRKDAPSGKCH